MFFRQAREGFLARRVVTEEQDGGFGEGPLAVGIADLLAGVRSVCRRILWRIYEAAIGDKVLHPWETADVMDLIQQHESEDFAAAWIERSR